jgi:hypothetical protein
VFALLSDVNKNLALMISIQMEQREDLKIALAALGNRRQEDKIADVKQS